MRAQREAGPQNVKFKFFRVSPGHKFLLSIRQRLGK